MPELPDVEVFKQYFDSTALQKTITDVQVQSSSVLKNISGKKFQEACAGRTFSDTSRHGKNLFIRLNTNGFWLVMHFGMTGFLHYFREMEKDTEHDRIRFDLSNGYHLAFDCQRKLGKIQLIKGMDSYIKEQKLGPDALDPGLDFETFHQALAGRKGSVKSVLMNQKVISGIGNVYSDEILLQAGILPTRRPDDLSKKELRDIYHAMNNVLKTAINHQADPKRFPRNYLTGNRKEGADCPACSAKIKMEKIGGRSSYFCPGCQK